MKAVLFDLDGTLSNSKEGITKCVQYALKHFGIEEPDRDKLEIFINQNGNSALAKAGTGDVLAGMIAGLLAQGMSCFEAGKLGVYLHSRCGEIASETLTEYSVMASDLVKYLPEVIKELN